MAKSQKLDQYETAELFNILNNNLRVCMQICGFCGRYVEDGNKHSCSAKQKLIKDLLSRISYLEEELEKANLDPNSKLLRNAQNLKDLHSRIYFLKEQLEKANLDPNSKLLRNAQVLQNDPIFQEYKDEFNKNRETMDKKVQELREKFKLLNNQYGEGMLNLPSKLAEISSSDNVSFIIPINKMLLGDSTVINSLTEQGTNKLLVKKFLDHCDLVNKRLDQIKENIDITIKTKEATLKSLENRFHELNGRVEEGFSNSELVDTFNAVRLKHIESKLMALKAQNNNLIFENEIEKLELLKNELNQISEEIEFIITIIMMDENNLPLSTLGELNAKQRGIISDGELNIIKYLRNVGFLDYISPENPIRDEEVTNEKNNEKIFDKLECVRSTLYVLIGDVENHPEKDKFDIDCDSTEIAEFFCEFIRKNCPDSRGILVTRDPKSKTIVLNFSQCKNEICLEVAELLDIINENLRRV